MKGYWGRAALAAWALVLAACGQSESPTPLPLQSPIELPTPPAPTAPAPPQPTAEPPGTVVLPFEVTPDTRATSRSVIATITALAATPTFPPTATRRPRPRPVGAGEGEVRQPSPTPILGDEVALVSFSPRVYPGGAAAVAVRARPGVVCTIAAEYQGDNQGAARALETPGADRRAGRDGVVAWILPIPQTQPPGTLLVRVSCEPSSALELEIEVAR